MAYDRQLIIQFLTGDSSDALIKLNAKALQKHAEDTGLKSHIVTLLGSSGLFSGIVDSFRVKALKHELAKLTSQSRVYLQGHGDWQSQKIADWGPTFSADFLVAAGLSAAKVVSILACEAARDLGTANDCRVANSTSSYASKFHARLREKHGIETEVYARVHCVAIGNKKVGPVGHKGTFNDDDVWEGWNVGQGGKRTESKIRFYWSGGVQQRQWAY